MKKDLRLSYKKANLRPTLGLSVTSAFTASEIALLLHRLHEEGVRVVFIDEAGFNMHSG